MSAVIDCHSFLTKQRFVFNTPYSVTTLFVHVTCIRLRQCNVWNVMSYSIIALPRSSPPPPSSPSNCGRRRLAKGHFRIGVTVNRPRQHLYRTKCYTAARHNERRIPPLPMRFARQICETVFWRTNSLNSMLNFYVPL
jgi:hypothetical protein